MVSWGRFALSFPLPTRVSLVVSSGGLVRIASLPLNEKIKKLLSERISSILHKLKMRFASDWIYPTCNRDRWQNKGQKCNLNYSYLRSKLQKANPSLTVIKKNVSIISWSLHQKSRGSMMSISNRDNNTGIKVIGLWLRSISGCLEIMIKCMAKMTNWLRR